MALSMLNIAIVIGITSACGAKTKSASDVASIFNVKPIGLGQKVEFMCQNLRERLKAPNLRSLALTSKDCLSAGLSAQNYRNLDEFNFANISATSVTGTRGNNTIEISTRSQIWLNKSLLSFISLVISSFKNFSNKEKGPYAAKASQFGGKFGQGSLSITEKPSFNPVDKDFTASFKFTLDGAVSIDNLLTLKAKVFSDMVVANLDTTNDQDFKVSLIKNAHAVVFIVPYANDIYVDASVKLVAHSVGADSVIAPQLQSALRHGMKTMLDNLLSLE